MGSSVNILYVLVMWNSFRVQNRQPNHTSKKFHNFLEVLSG